MRSLLAIRGMLPYILVVFINAFVDLGHKITIQNTVFKVYDGNTQIILTAIVNALILLPFILLFSPAGFLADRYPKNRIMRAAAWVAVAITLLITVCYYHGYFWPAFALTFVLAVQSAFYSPSKYGYIKVLAGNERLSQANALVQAVTITSILAGTFVFSIIFEYYYGGLATPGKSEILLAIAPLGWVLVANSVLELILAYRIPQLEEPRPEMRFSWKNYFTGRSLKENIQPLARNRIIRMSVLGLAVFWSISQVMLAAFPAFAKETLSVTNTVVIQGTLAASGIGIILGSLLAGRWSRRYIETGIIPIGAAGIAIGLFLLPGIDSVAGHIINFFFIGVAGGLFIVPLNAMIQFLAADDELGKVLAGNNLVQNISMLGFLVLTAVVAYLGIATGKLLLLIAAVALVGGAYTVLSFPQSMLRFLVTYMLSRRYKVNVQGFNNIPEQGGVLMLGNHISFIDWAIVQIASPRPVRFVMVKTIYERWYLKWFLEFFGVVPIGIGGGSKSALKSMTELLNRGEVVCLFPEGSVSRTGHLAEFRRGYEKACEDASDDVVILPFYLRGLWGSRFSRSTDRLKSDKNFSFARDIIVAFGEPLAKTTKADVLKRRVFDLSVHSWSRYVETLPTLPEAWIDTAKAQGGELAIADTLADPLSATRALTAAIVFSRKIKRLSPKQNVGLLLPTSSGAVLANMAILLNGQTVVNLNYTSSLKALDNAMDIAELDCIFSSRRFMEKLKGRGVDVDALCQIRQVYYLEDVKEGIAKAELMSTMIMVRLLPARLVKLLFCHAHNPASTAAILFSSGSEGMPKGVMLSHHNILGNLKQISDVLNLQSDDVVMASLPLFHAFGLTVNQFMPLIEGAPMVCHADPTDAVGSAKAIARYRATIFCGTSTFLRMYIKNRRVHPLMLESLRLVVAGAEKLSDDVRQSFRIKFGKEIYEGYGATETTPVASTNLPDQLDSSYWEVHLGQKFGTVGMPLPGTSFKIVDPGSMEELPTGEDGMILIGGCQVMQGYLGDPDKTATVISEINGVRWYQSGDKGHLDSDGFLTIVDRYSRFAKLAGEMISLAAVEAEVRKALDDPEMEIMAATLVDERKGEKIALLTVTEINNSELTHRMIQGGCSPLMVPAVLYQVDQLPVLGSGKADFKQAQKLVAELAAAS